MSKVWDLEVWLNENIKYWNNNYRHTTQCVCVCLNAYIILLSDFRVSLQKTPLTPDVVIN